MLFFDICSSCLLFPDQPCLLFFCYDFADSLAFSFDPLFHVLRSSTKFYLPLERDPMSQRAEVTSRYHHEQHVIDTRGFSLEVLREALIRSVHQLWSLCLTCIIWGQQNTFCNVCFADLSMWTHKLNMLSYYFSRLKVSLSFISSSFMLPWKQRNKQVSYSDHWSPGQFHGSKTGDVGYQSEALTIKIHCFDAFIIWFESLLGLLRIMVYSSLYVILSSNRKYQLAPRTLA